MSNQTPEDLLRANLRGTLLRPGDAGYDDARKVYNAMIDRRPRLIARCADVADVITAVGYARDHGLLLAVRGGGNFGIVTSFLFRLHPVKDIVGGPTLWHLADAPKVMRWYRDFIAAAPEDLNGWFAFLTVPPVPPFPEALWLKKMCAVVWCYVGPPERAAAVFAPIAGFGPPALHGVHAMPFPFLQAAFDKLYPPGHQWYWRADFVDELSDAAIALHEQYAAQLPTPQSGMHLYPVDGAVHRVGRSETAFSYRETRWASVTIGVDPDPANREKISDWTRRYHDALHPHSAGGAYVNFMMDEGQERVQATYRDNYARLAAVKAKYDPGNLFRVNQNVRPVAARAAA